MPRWRSLLPLGLLLSVYMLLAGAYGSRIPLWEAPDAVWHYEFAAHLAAGGGLPSRVDEGLAAPWRQEGSQPPLYYLAAAPWIALVGPADAASAIRMNPHANVGVTDPGGNLNHMVHGAREVWPWRGTVLAARLVGLSGLLWGLLAVVATWGLARTVWPSAPPVALLAAALVAFNPQFVFMSTAISNDVTAAATAALSLWAMAALLRHGPTRGRLVVLGGALGLAALAKLSGVWMLGLGVVVALWEHRPRSALGGLAARRPPARTRAWGWVRLDRWGTGLARDLGWLLVPAGLVAGWWYGRNWLLFGDPTGLPLMWAAMTRRTEPPGWQELVGQAGAVWKSYWAVFGWFNVPAPEWVFALMTGLVVVGLAGLGLACARRQVPRDAWPGLALAGLWLGMMVGAAYLWARVQYPQGRLLFPAASALALLLATGWLLPLGERARRWAAVGISGGLVALSAWLLPGVILPAYAAPAVLSVDAAEKAVTGLGWSVPVQFGGQLALDRVYLSPSLDGATLHTGDTVVVTLPWRVLTRPDRDWSVFLHLVDEEGVVVAQRDSYPGGGALPTGDWQVGQVVTDTQRLTIPFTAGSPACDGCRLWVGLYDAATGERLSVGPATDALHLGGVHVQPTTDAAGRPVLPAPVRFGDDIALDGYALHRRALDPGQKLKLTLYWRALAAPKADHRVSVQLRQGDRIMAQADAAPADDTRPTSGWQRSETIEDSRSFRVPKATPPGDYTLFVRLVRPNGEPLPVDYRHVEHSLGPVRVTVDR